MRTSVLNNQERHLMPLQSCGLEAMRKNNEHHRNTSYESFEAALDAVLRLVRDEYPRRRPYLINPCGLSRCMGSGRFHIQMSNKNTYAQLCRMWFELDK